MKIRLRPKIKRYCIENQILDKIEEEAHLPMDFHGLSTFRWATSIYGAHFWIRHESGFNNYLERGEIYGN
jgi:hypothetical protein